MANFSDRISVLIDVTTEKATAGLKNFKTAVSEAEGFTGKLKAGLGAASDALFSPAGLAAGASLGAGALFKLGENASNTGIEIGKLKDATGLSADAASRWVEVAKDMNIGADNMAGLIEKMTKKLGDSPQAFQQYNIDVVKAHDGTVNMSETLINTIGALSNIQDPTKRAAAGAAIFGKSWADASELIAAGADKVREKLHGVNGDALFTNTDIQQARDFRDAMANFKDVGEHLALTIGKEVLPKLTTMLDGVLKIEKAGERIGLFGGGDSQSKAAALSDAYDKYGSALLRAGQRFVDMKGGQDIQIKSLDDLTRLFTATSQPALEAWIKAQEDLIDTYPKSVERRQASFDATKNETGALTDLVAARDHEKKVAEDAAKAIDDLRKAEDDIYTNQYDHIKAQRDYADSLQAVKDAIKGNGTDLAQALQDASEKYAALNGATAGTKEGLDQQVAFLSMIETGYKKGSPAWNAIEDLKKQFEDVQKLAGAQIASEGEFHPAGMSNVGVSQVSQGVYVHTLNITAAPTPQGVIDAITAWERRNGTSWRR